MFKAKLQELCQKRKWELPEYVTRNDGLPHLPCFNTNITVNGITFHNQSICRSIKISQNDAAKLALHHFITSPSSSNLEVPDSTQPVLLPPPPSSEQQQLPEEVKPSHVPLSTPPSEQPQLQEVQPSSVSLSSHSPSQQPQEVQPSSVPVSSPSSLEQPQEVQPSFVSIYFPSDPSQQLQEVEPSSVYLSSPSDPSQQLLQEVQPSFVSLSSPSDPSQQLQEVQPSSVTLSSPSDPIQQPQGVQPSSVPLSSPSPLEQPQEVQTSSVSLYSPSDPSQQPQEVQPSSVSLSSPSDPSQQPQEVQASSVPLSSPSPLQQPQEVQPSYVPLSSPSPSQQQQEVQPSLVLSPPPPSEQPPLEPEEGVQSSPIPSQQPQLQETQPSSIPLSSPPSSPKKLQAQVPEVQPASILLVLPPLPPSPLPSSQQKQLEEVQPSATPLGPLLSSLPAVSCFVKPVSEKRASHIVGYPRMGPKRELKFALESFWDGKSSADELKKVSADLRSSIWKQMADAGIRYIPSNTFSYYDHMLDTTAMLGAVPPRYGWTGGEIGLDIYFSMARGNANIPAMKMAKWFDTNYHFIVPELGPQVKFSYASRKAVDEFKEAKRLGADTVPVLVGPVSYLLLSKPAKGVDESFSLLSLLPQIVPIYKEVIADLKSAGATWIQLDEPALVKDLDSNSLEAFTVAYSVLESSLSGLNVLVETYFADVSSEAYKILISLKGVTAFGFDLVRGTRTLDLIKRGFPEDKFLFAGVVDGRNVWANDLDASLSTLASLEGIVGKDKLVVSTSCSLLHTPVDLVNENKLDNEIKSWLAFAAQKVVEVDKLAKAVAGQKDEAFFSANAATLASRKSSPRVANEAVKKAVAAWKGSSHRRATPVKARLHVQNQKLNLPILPTTTTGPFPQTAEFRRVRQEYKAKKISEEEYVNAIREEISNVVKLQEELDIDVLVHGEPERNDMVAYFGEHLSGFASTVNGWVQSYGSRCVKPPIIYGDVSRPKPMTVFWTSMAQSMTKRPMKGMLTGPVTILNWSFARNDQPRHVTCYQIALAIKDEVEDLEKAGINVIQIDEAALREGLPLRKSEEAFYLDWAVHSFRITNFAVQDTTQIHTHICYSHFHDIIHSIIDMDADVVAIDNSHSDEKLLSVFGEGVKNGAGIVPGVYDVHSSRTLSTEEIADWINKMLAVLEKNILWINPYSGLKTRNCDEVKLALLNTVSAVKLIRTQLATAE